VEKGKKIPISAEVYDKLEVKAKALGKTADELAVEMLEEIISHG